MKVIVNRARCARSSALFRRFLPALLLLGCALIGCSRNAEPASPLVMAQGGLKITVTTTPSPPRTGDDVLHVLLTDSAAGVPIGNANLTATVDMLAPRLPGAVISGRAQGLGHYDIPVQLAVATQYAIKLHIELTGQEPQDFVIPLEAVQKGN